MADTLKSKAAEYKPPQTKNIADLEKVSVDLELREETYTDKDGNDFTVEVVEVKGEKYRVPTSVKAQLKELLEVKPEMKHFRVKKSGEGMNTKYMVIDV